ncbi:MAG TPA: PAS domain S-box protein [Geobacteraceae bacterium]
MFIDFINDNRNPLLDILGRLPVPVLIIEGEAILFNRATEQLTGYGREEIVSLSDWFRKLYGDLHEQVRGLYEADRAAGFPAPREVPVTRKDGSVRFVEFAATGSDQVVCILYDVTERTRAAEAVIVSKQRYRQIVETASEGIWMIDAERRTTFVNRKLLEILGYGEEEMVGRLMTDFMYPEDLAACTARMQERSQGVQGCYEQRLRRADGTEVWCAISATPTTASDGRFLGSFAMLTNVTERVRAQALLRESEQLLRESQRVAQLGSYVFDITSGNWTSSAKLDEIFGIDASYPKQFDSWVALIHPDFRAEMREYVLTSVVADRRRFDREYPIIRPCDGAERWVSGLGDLILDEDGNVVRMLGTIQDVTERKVREETVMRLNRALVDLARDKELHRVDLDRALAVIIRASAAATRTRRTSIWFYSPDRRGINCINLYDLESGEHSRGGYLAVADFPAYFKAARSGEVIDAHDAVSDPRTREFADIYLRPHGITSMLDIPLIIEGQVFGVVCHEHVGTPRRWTPEEQSFATAIAGIVTTIIEMHQRRKAEEEVRSLSFDLERRVGERTGLLESALKQAESFSYSVSHDLRAPLRAIHGYAQIIDEEFSPLLPVSARQYLGKIADNITRMTQLIDDLLTFSRLNLRPVDRQLVDPEQLVRALIGEHVPPTAGARLAITVRELPSCHADPSLLRQVYLNLIDNAIKFTGKREQAVIEIGATTQADRTVYYVRDNGAGFDMEYAAKLFNVFHRLHHPDEFEGTGVGLAIVHNIIARHDGTVWAEAAPDRGATFFFTLGAEGPLPAEQGSAGSPELIRE